MLVENGGWAASRNDLYWNNGDGTFRSGNAGNLTQLTRFAGSWPACADYDGDGWVDIYLAEGPSGSGPFTTRFYHATGLGTFTPVDFGQPLSMANDAVWGDYDNDGDPDLFVCNYTSPSSLWRNDGHGQFTKMANGLPSTANTLHAAWADFDRDGDLDIALSSFQGTLLYRNNGTSGFAYVTNFAAAIGCPAWADYDNDGFLDLLVVGGQDTPRKAALYHNNGNGTFTSVTEGLPTTADYFLACPWGDFDNDGFMDVVLTHQYGNNRLYRNLGSTNHWIKFKLVGTMSNRDAIGAKVRVHATLGGQSVWQMQEVNGGYMLQNDTRLNFGLLDATNVDSVRIEWPSGTVQDLRNLASNQILTIVEPRRPLLALQAAPTGVTGTLRADTNQVYQVLVANDLAAGWTVLTNLTTDTNGIARWLDTPTAPQGRRFYKALKWP